ncbi:MAG TPA: protein translocase subunit SecF [Spirochaetota bacterium]|mgnify:CR=1 FL=1|nr:protein translocase subunit SecF [Spirochaetota bacterium]HOM10743.1 protein translocase subunit SecF [Spirochaetota bacterium]HPP50081.1 protein translocase subunit SecF [Spirochaetota bacterium]
MEKIIPFIRYRFIAYAITITLIVIFSLQTYRNGGFNWGIDFVGGIKLTVKFEQGVDTAQIRKVLTQNKISAVIQQVGKEEDNEYLISTKLASRAENVEESTKELKAVIQSNFKNVEILSIETVGPAIGDFLKKSAGKLIALSIIIMTLYLAFRFELKYSIGAMVALVHDVILSVLFCGFAGIEINIPIVAAILTIYGYSVNDTIIIFDRVRENLQIKTKQTFIDVIDKSITQTISRTLLTALTTLFAVFALYMISGEGLNEFASVLLFGIVIGTYSSMYLASPFVLYWEKLTLKKA